MENSYDGTNVIKLSNKDFDDKILINKKFKNKNGLIKFYAPWCSFCKNMKSDIIFLSNGLREEDFCVGVVNTDNDNELSNKFNISGIPALFLVDSKGKLTALKLKENTIENILENICNFTKKCCKKEDNNIVCN